MVTPKIILAVSSALLLAPCTRAQIGAGTPAPDIVFDDRCNLDASIQSLAELRGAAVLLEFCATWCGPCRAQIPHMNELQAQYAERGLVVVGVMEEALDKVKPWVEQNGVAYPIVVEASAAGMKTYGVLGFPCAFLIDPDGTVAWSGHPGQLPAAAIERATARAVSPLTRLADQLAPVQGLLDLGQKGKAMAMLQMMLQSGKLEGKVKERAEAVLRRLGNAAAAAMARVTLLLGHEEWFAAAVILHEVAATFAGTDHAVAARSQLHQLTAADASRSAAAAAAFVVEARRLFAAKKYDAAWEQYHNVLTSPCRQASEEASKAMVEIRSKGLLGFEADCRDCAAAGKACSKHAKN